MPPKAAAGAAPYGVKPMVLDFESRVDEIAKLVRAFVELKSGFGEDHAKSRTMQNIFKQFDIDHTGTISKAEFGKTLDYMNIRYTEDEKCALFERYDSDLNGTLTFKEFADNVFGIAAAPQGNPEARSVIKKITDKLLARAGSGEGSLRMLTKTFALADRDGSQELAKEELFNSLQRYGIQVALTDVDVVIKHFDTTGDGKVSLPEFMRALRGYLPESRLALIRTAYAICDVNHDQSVKLGELAALYRADKHPAVIKGEKTATQVMQEFVQMWDKDQSGVITAAEFEDYYRDISAVIEDDTYFELMIRNAWHISGGTGAGQNTTCRRVLVSYRDGRQLIEEIQNDLGIGPRDVDKMKAALERQGLRDIVKVEPYGAA